MKRKAESNLPRERTELGQLGRAFAHLVMELRHPWMGRVRREVGRHAVHGDPGRREVTEHVAEVREADAQVRAVLPTPAVMALQIGPCQRLDNKS
jgi:hypothetical protein